MPSPRTIGVGLIGYGQMGRIHTLAYRTIPLYYEPAPALLRLVGVCDAVKERAEIGRIQGGYEIACSDPMELIGRKDVDLICVCTPNKLHYPVVKAALEAGKHIFCEKPLGFDLKESEELAALEKKSKGKHMVNAEFRYINAALTAKDLIRQGRVGRIFHFRGGHLHSGYVDPKKPREWRLVKSIIGGGVLTDLGPHILDLVEAALGPVTELTAQGDPRDWVAVQMLHESGARSDVTMSCASAIEPSRTELELYGRDRSIALDARAGARSESFARVRAEFAAAARSGGPHPCDAARGLELQRLVDRVARALADPTT